MHCKEARRRGINGSISYPVSGSVSSPVICFEVEMADNDIETQNLPKAPLQPCPYGLREGGKLSCGNLLHNRCVYNSVGFVQQYFTKSSSILCSKAVSWRLSVCIQHRIMI